MALQTSTPFLALVARPAPRQYPAALPTPHEGISVRADPALDAYRWRKPVVGEWAFSSAGHRWAPITVYLHGTLGQVIDALARAGWSEIDPLRECEPVPDSAACGAAFERSLLGRWPRALPSRYAPRGTRSQPEPATPPELLYQGELPVLSCEKEGDPLGWRRHLRVYDTAQSDADGAEVWAVCAGRDLGLAFSARRPGRYLTPAIDKDADRERDALFEELAAAQALEGGRTLLVTWQEMSPDHPRSQDGKVYELVLR